MHQVTSEFVAMTGMNFFSIRREIIFTVSVLKFDCWETGGLGFESQPRNELCFMFYRLQGQLSRTS